MREMLVIDKTKLYSRGRDLLIQVAMADRAGPCNPEY